MVLLVSYYGPFGELLWSFWSVTVVLLVSYYGPFGFVMEFKEQ